MSDGFSYASPRAPAESSEGPSSWWHALYDPLIPPSLRADPEERRRARILLYILSVVALVVIFFLVKIIDHGVLPATARLSLIIGTFSLALNVALLHAFRSLWPPTLLLFAQWGGFMGHQAWLDAGLRDPCLTVLVLLPWIGMVLLGYPGALAGFFAVALTVTVLFGAHHAGYGVQNISPPALYWYYEWVFLIAVGLVVASCACAYERTRRRGMRLRSRVTAYEPLVQGLAGLPQPAYVVDEAGHVAYGNAAGRTLLQEHGTRLCGPPLTDGSSQERVRLEPDLLRRLTPAEAPARITLEQDQSPSRTFDVTTSMTAHGQRMLLWAERTEDLHRQAALTARARRAEHVVEAHRERAQHLLRSLRVHYTELVSLLDDAMETRTNGTYLEPGHPLHRRATLTLAELDMAELLERLDAGRIEVQLERVDLAGLLRLHAARLEAYARQLNVHLRVSPGNQPVLVLADERVLAKLFRWAVLYAAREADGHAVHFRLHVRTRTATLLAYAQGGTGAARTPKGSSSPAQTLLDVTLVRRLTSLLAARAECVPAPSSGSPASGLSPDDAPPGDAREAEEPAALALHFDVQTASEEVVPS